MAARSARTTAALVAGALTAMVTAAAAAPDAATPLPMPDPRGRPPAEAPATPPPSPAPAAEPPAAPSETTLCHGELARLGGQFTPATPSAGAAQCRVESPVRLDSVTLDGRIVRFPDRPLVACRFAVRLVSFTRDLAAPVARGITGADLTALGTGNGLECRPRNHVAGARLSAHGLGLAVDVAWIEVAGRPRIAVEAPGSPEGERLVDSLRRAGCGWFTTVLGPGSDAAHANHLHLDGEPRGRDGQSRFCQ